MQRRWRVGYLHLLFWPVLHPSTGRFVSRRLCNVTYWRQKLFGSLHLPSAGETSFICIDAVQKRRNLGLGCIKGRAPFRSKKQFSQNLVPMITVSIHAIPQWGKTPKKRTEKKTFSTYLFFNFYGTINIGNEKIIPIAILSS